ncbi:penicillin-insensitive murein endopeptidase [Peredibacter starrii]|uniref:Penicillin-insensitive murein endopeptidase n=1 Tax=Peredibacter starrii TaxID=28202 RepID=A0AAX4HQN8_9BACT|nr:penicillin-insensitive murein endopeptidase [Peredibacter starrii]WPU65433.1 penicillin-insensitive murein endopeptidase [Peredibacter starrii]
MFKVFICLCFISTAFAQRLPSPQGFYSKGTILFAQQLPLEGEGFMRLFVHRDRGFGSLEMLNLIKRAALEMNLRYPMRDRMQLGDIAQMKGGQISRHNSHQNGLDADIAYFRVNGMEQLPDVFDGFNEDMVINGKISENFDFERNWELMKTLHRYGKVQRIFVDEVVKREVCHHAISIGEHDEHVEVLRSLRPFDNHKHHMHVRIRCPDTAKKCVAQEETPAGSGCELL